jgi:hypothetical protein
MVCISATVHPATAARNLPREFGGNKKPVVEAILQGALLLQHRSSQKQASMSSTASATNEENPLLSDLLDTFPFDDEDERYCYLRR